IEIRDSYLYIVFLLPLLGNGERTVKISELNVFVGKDYVLTIHEGPTPSLDDFFTLLTKYAKARAKYMKSPEWLMYHVVRRIHEYGIPILNRIDEDIDALEVDIFEKEPEQSLLKEIAIVRRNIIDYRKIVQPHRSVILQLESALQKSHDFKMKPTDAYYEDLTIEAQTVWDQLENFKERIEALQETNASLSSFRINDTVRTLTMISAILLPMSLVASIFGMNTENHPIIGDPSDFWIVLLIMALLSLGMIFFFRFRRWL
ncbi:MAG: magnesium transporter CorA family protein, partial [Candidatus Kerfeldbacteria bacterium]|nr:magnesium transporter CorA family protein [Candidatus Kerfeldbacteria bacterium]